jgi:hypothetical protein
MKKIRLLFFMLLTTQTIFAQWMDQSSWSHRGPFKNGTGIYETGRLDVITLHPGYNGTTNKTIYTGGINGGLWRTTDGGVNWTNIPSNYMQYSGIGDMAFNSTGTYLYVADRASLGYNLTRGSGVYRYEVSTGIWTKAGTFQDGTLVTSKAERLRSDHLKIHPADDQLLLLASNAGLYVTTNAGGSWTLKASGEFENIAFVPSAATGGYDIYATGSNMIMKSTDKGVSFSAIPTPSPNNPFTTYTNPYFDVAYGGLDVDGTSKILYFHGWIPSPTTYVVYKYKIPTSGSPTMTFLFADQSLVPRNPDVDRLCVAGNKDMVYIGGANLLKYKVSSNRLYDPVPVPNGTDVLLNVGTYPGYYYGGSNPYSSMMHPDLHDIKIFDNGTTRKIFVAHDGGFSEDTYTTTGTAGVYTNSWTYRNNGIHVASISGFSGSETDPDVYATGEQDTKGFVFNEAMTKVTSFGVEPRMVLLDKKKKTLTSGNQGFRLFHNSHLSDNSLSIAEVDFTTAPGTYTGSSTGLYECDPVASYFLPNSTPSDGIRLPQCRMYYQDPVRQQNIYAFAGGVWKLDDATQKFGLKYRTGKYLNDVNVLKRDHWVASVVNSMAVSKTNKNKIYMAAEYDPGSPFASQIYRYIGPDIDNSWEGHNELDWDIITPNLNAAPFNLGMTNTEIFNVDYHSLVLSDWDENKLWIAATGIEYSTIPNHTNLKVLKYDNGNWSNYSDNIPLDETPQNMVYERGSNDGIYLTTERNVYYRNSFMTQWELYNNGNLLPHLFSRQMEINYTENTLRLGTYGRGIWKTNLTCPTAATLTKNNCINCNSALDYFWEATTASISNTTLTTNKQIVRAVTSIDILPETTLDPSGNTAVYYELFIHGCATGSKNSFRTYQDFDPYTDANEEEEEKEMDLLGQISIYPNPNNGTFTVNTENSEAKDIYVYNALGEIVFQKNKTSERTLDIDISNVPKGIYLVKVVFDDKTETMKIIHQ